RACDLFFERLLGCDGTVRLVRILSGQDIKNTVALFCPQCTSEFTMKNNAMEPQALRQESHLAFRWDFLFKDQQDFNMKQRAQGGSLLEC
ncbi:MAG: hypothetical protein ACLRP7_05790, partial [Christensenellales bacterium]